MYEHLVERRTVEPTFYRDFPVEVAPLTRAHRDDPRLAEKWDLVAFGTEIGTGYSELVDPVEQRARLTAQSLLAAGGDPEAMQLDEDFLRALEYGMPPTGGMGMGIDRMLIMLTGASDPGDDPVPAGPPGVTGRTRSADRLPASRLPASRGSSADDADGAHVDVPHDRLDLDRLPEVRCVDHQAVADVEADVTDVGEEEHQVTRAAGRPGPRARPCSTGRR